MYSIEDIRLVAFSSHHARRDGRRVRHRHARRFPRQLDRGGQMGTRISGRATMPGPAAPPGAPRIIRFATPSSARFSSTPPVTSSPADGLGPTALVRLFPDGRRDSAFRLQLSPKPSGVVVMAIARQPDGKLLRVWHVRWQRMQPIPSNADHGRSRGQAARDLDVSSRHIGVVWRQDKSDASGAPALPSPGNRRRWTRYGELVSW